MDYYKDQVLFRGSLQLSHNTQVSLAIESIDGRLSLFPGKKWVLKLIFYEGDGKKDKTISLSAKKCGG